jgi:imidazolonepropionase-like amidohydrolase
MKIIKPALILSALLFLAIGQAAAQPIAFTNITVIDVEEGVARPGMSVIVTGDRITDVGSMNEIDVPDGATIVDGTDKYLIPGLWDMHVHEVYDSDKPRPWDFHAPSPDAADPRDIYMPIKLAYGITGVREMFGGLATIEQRERIERGEMLGPHIVIGSPILDGPQPVFPDPDSALILIDGPERAREVASNLYAQGFDFLKPYSYLSAESYRALLERAGELGMEVTGHVPISVSTWEVAELGQRTIEHLIGIEFACSSREDELRELYVARIQSLDDDSPFEERMGTWYRSEWEPIESLDPEKCDALFEHLAAHDTWVVPTLIIQRGISYYDDPRIANDPNLRYEGVGPEDLKATADRFDPERRLRTLYDYRASVIDELHNAGVGILAGTDLSGGFNLHYELELYVESGLSPLAALRTATVNPARYLGRENDLGSITPGKIADLVLLSANPLEDITNTQKIETVLFQGHLLERDQLDRMLEQLATDRENWPK